MIIDRGVGKRPVRLTEAGRYTFTYKGEKYEARSNSSTGDWTVGLVIGRQGFEPMATRHDLAVAINAALDDVDKINELMSRWGK